MFSFLKSMFSSKKNVQGQVSILYAQLVAAARQKSFYENNGVPDSPEGRYGMVIIHVFLLIRYLRLKKAYEISQQIFDLFFADMDQSLREMGVGDVSVGKKIRNMATVFYNRSAAYDRALDSQNTQKLAILLEEHFYQIKPEKPSKNMVKIAQYMFTKDRLLVSCPLHRLFCEELFNLREEE